MEVEMPQDRRREAEELATMLATGALRIDQLNAYQRGLYDEFKELMDLTRAAYSGEIQPAPHYPGADLSFLDGSRSRRRWWQSRLWPWNWLRRRTR
jgi:uncharacterized coiled-coil protein SlyX